MTNPTPHAFTLAAVVEPDEYGGYCNHCGLPDDGEAETDQNGVYECSHCGNDRVVCD